MSRAIASSLATRQLTCLQPIYYYDIIFREAKVAKEKVIALTATSERSASTMSGYAMLVLLLVAIAADAYGIATVNRAVARLRR